MILASKSPRRKEILEQIGFNLKIIVKEIEEISDKKDVTSKIKDIARKKAIEVAKDYPNEFVVGADTLVEVDGELLGKPVDKDEAKEMLKKLSNRKHRVITAYSLINLNRGIDIVDYSENSVYMREITPSEIDWYIKSNEPMDKAGAYGIQGLGTIFIDKIDGDFYSIMGFPINKFIKTLLNMGINITEIENI